MRKQEKSRRLLKAAFAAVLACGMMVPAGAAAWADDEKELVPPPSLIEGSIFDSEIGDRAADSVDNAETFATIGTVVRETAQVYAAQMAASTPTATPMAGGTKVGGFNIAGGTQGTDYELVGTTVQVKTDTWLTFSNASSGSTNYNIQINAGVHANIILDGVDIGSSAAASPINMITNCNDTASGSKAASYKDVINKTSLNLILADGSTNNLTAPTGWPALRCGEGSVLVIDDALENVDAAGNMVVPHGGVINSDVTLKSGKELKAGQVHNVLNSDNPGVLKANAGSDGGAGIGGFCCENSGEMTFNGGDITANGGSSGGAGICGGAGSGGTVTTFNAGTINAQGAYHAAGVGGGYYFNNGNKTLPADAIPNPRTGSSYNANSPRGGDITVNGGFLSSRGGGHGGAFGYGCDGTNIGHTILVTGGTIIADGNGFPDIAGGNCDNSKSNTLGGHVVITGGSVFPAKNRFDGVGGTAWGNRAFDEPGYDVTKADDPNKVFMVTIDLSSELEGSKNNLITSWDLTIKGEKYNYGSPNQFYNGKVYLWLPKSATSEQVAVTLKYLDDDGAERAIDPLFRNPGSVDTLKRYINFELPDEYIKSLSKYYDGKPPRAYNLDAQPITTTEKIPKKISDSSRATYVYQRFDAIDGNPLGREFATTEAQSSDAGIVKFTLTSTQWADETGFKENYWGHRAYGWCEIKPTTSAIDLVSATWQDGKDGSVMEDGRQRLTVNATVKPGDKDPDGNPNASTCAAPRGSIQLYVDGKPVGEPVKMVFAGDKDETGAEIPAGDPRVNATASGSATAFQYVFIPAEKDFLLPDATGDNKHEVSVQYLPPSAGDAEAANYLASTNPADDPELPKADVVIEPVRPDTDVTAEPDPEAPEDAPKPTFDLDPNPKPTDPEEHPTGDTVYPGDKTFTGSVETTYDDPTADNPHPGRVYLKIKSESSGDISIVDDEDNPFTADFVRDENGNPVKDDEGNYTLIVDPTAPGKGTLHIAQVPNGAFTGTHWDIEVNVKPNPKVAPKPSVTKTAENLTHPEGPTQPGDRIKYTISAANTAAGSAWLDVTLSDALPVGLTLDPATVHLDNPSEMFDDALAAGSPTALGEFGLADGTNGRPILTVMAGGVYGGRGPAVLTFECTVSEEAAGHDISNTAEAQGSRPDPENPDGPNLPVDTDPTDPVTPPGGGTVRPGDPDISFTKAVSNVTDPAAKMTKVGDILRYTVTLENKGAASTCLMNAVVSDPMPAGIEPVAGTIVMALSDGAAKDVHDSAYDTASRTIAVSAGDLWGGQKVTLTFDATVTEAALGHDNSNIALVHGTIPSGAPDGTPPADADPGQPVKPPAGEPLVPSPAAEPPTIVGADPVDGDLKANKVASNLTRQDGTTKVGDTVRYTISVTNSGTATSWMDAAVRDDIPKGLEPMSGTMKMTLADGKEIAVSDGAYDSASRIISVAAGHIYGGQTVTLAFEALVVDEAVGADIGNTASAYGQPPSKWDPDAAHAEPGQPFTPGDGWAVYERTREKIMSPTAYAPGTSHFGGVLPLTGNGTVDQSGTITGIRLAQTGDMLLRFAVPVAVCAVLVLATGAALGRLRRRADS